MKESAENPTAGTATAAASATEETAAQEAFDPTAFRLTPEAALERRRGSEHPVYLFDLREMEDFQEGHLPGAYSLPMGYLQDNLHRLPFAGDLIFYDGGEGRGRQAARILYDNGFTDQFYVEEGFQGLQAALERSPDEIQYGRLSEEERHRAIDRVLDEKVRAFLERDGGGLEVAGIEGDRVLVSYFGACGSCGSSTAGTLRFIQNTLTVSLNHEIEVVPVD